jgi:bifunctional DNA-binding transcriptional regulator/antitoxin component of YhaV-PrlF toxin-antitoxin module
VTRKGQVTLRKDLLAHLGLQPGQRIDVEVLPGGRLELQAEQATGSITNFIGLLAGRSSHCASLEELNQAAAAGWARLKLLASGGDFADGVIAFGGGSWAANSWHLRPRSRALAERSWRTRASAAVMRAVAPPVAP